MLRFPDFSRPFYLKTDASDYQLGGIVTQKDDADQEHIVASYSKKLNRHQRNYDVTSKEQLCIAEMLKEYRDILLGHKIVVRTDHKNLESTTRWLTLYLVWTLKRRRRRMQCTSVFLTGTSTSLLKNAPWT